MGEVLRLPLISTKHKALLEECLELQGQWLAAHAYAETYPRGIGRLWSWWKARKALRRYLRRLAALHWVANFNSDVAAEVQKLGLWKKPGE